MILRAVSVWCIVWALALYCATLPVHVHREIVKLSPVCLVCGRDVMETGTAYVCMPCGVECVRCHYVKELQR